MRQLRVLALKVVGAQAVDQPSVVCNTRFNELLPVGGNLRFTDTYLFYCAGVTLHHGGMCNTVARCQRK